MPLLSHVQAESSNMQMLILWRHTLSSVDNLLFHSSPPPLHCFISHHDHDHRFIACGLTGGWAATGRALAEASQTS